MTTTLHKADFWLPSENSSVRCLLCPRHCMIPEGRRGFCSVRINLEGVLYSLVYGHPVAIQIDPIEKKPFSEFMPGTRTFSIGTYGCNLDCSFCQNYHLSRGKPAWPYPQGDKPVSPEWLVNQAELHGCQSMALTYNEPTVWLEYGYDIAAEAKKKEIPVVLVSNGYICREPAEKFYPLIAAANIDMKGFSQKFYSEMTKSELEPVLDAIRLLFKLKVHIEITNLVIPGKNDDVSMIEDFLKWVETELDKNVPLHFSAFFPTHRLLDVEPTPASTLYKIREYSRKRGFSHIYLGNTR